MPRRVPVQSLLTSSMRISAYIICEVLEKAFSLPSEGREGNVTYEIQNYVSVLPLSLKEKVLHYILDSDRPSPAVKYQALANILCPEMKSLTPGIFPQTYFMRVSHVISCQGKALQTLDLRGIWLKGELMTELLNVLSCLKQLRDLRIPHMATDVVLETIGQYNLLLQRLDISGECNVTDVGIESLCNAGKSIITYNLQFILLGNRGGTELSPGTVSLIIKYFPKLQSLGSYPNVAEAIQCLTNNGETITTNLIYVHDSNTDLNSIDMLAKSMPFLESIFIDHPTDGVISRMSNFPRLTNLKLQRFQVNEFFKLIDKIGKQISSLELIMGSGIFDFSLLSKHCPNLVKFSGFKMECIRHFNKLEFPNIKKIGVYYSDISPSCVKSSIIASPNVEKLSFGDEIEITDDDIIEIFTTHEYSDLKHVWFPNAVFLTSVSVQIFIECCPNLITLGDLSGWNMSRPEILVFKEMVEDENLCFNII